MMQRRKTDQHVSGSPNPSLQKLATPTDDSSLFLKDKKIRSATQALHRRVVPPARSGTYSRCARAAAVALAILGALAVLRPSSPGVRSPPKFSALRHFQGAATASEHGRRKTPAIASDHVHHDAPPASGSEGSADAGRSGSRRGG